MRNVVIIGGGLAGLISSIELAREGISCTVVEKKSYPLHRVCGEYVSNEALPFLTASGLYPKEFDPPKIKFLELSSVAGQSVKLKLGLGGFGISRFAFDHFLFQVAKAEGVSFLLNTEASAVTFEADKFLVNIPSGALETDVVIGAFGKRSRIDVQQNRRFLKERSPYLGVKYHVRTRHPAELISLHNFPGGYCGVCSVEDGKTNLCYLTHRRTLKEWGHITAMERHVLFRNPHLEKIFSEAEFLFDKPEVINEVSFETKGPLANHILMTGDAAGMITPACGNGMAIALHSGKMVADVVKMFCKNMINRGTLEGRYMKIWEGQFQRRLWLGRKVQGLFGNPYVSSLAVGVARFSPAFARALISNTHGNPF